VISSFAYADGYKAGYVACGREMDKDVSVALTDPEFTQQIDRIIPAMLALVEHQEWRKGFILGWVMVWCEAASHPDEDDEE
jgi:hypothetical protein